MKSKQPNKFITPAVIFIILMGIVSMLSDMTHEGAKSIYGVFLETVGASPSTISIISGLGEFLGSALILLTSYIAARTKKYWLFTIIGYGLNILVIPALALTGENGWVFAVSLILIERIGRAIRKPAKNTLVSFAGADVGAGKAFAIQEFLDQLGAFIGPLILTLALSLKGNMSDYEAYRMCFLILGIPAILTLTFLLIVRAKYPHPENQFEIEEKKEEGKKKFKISKEFIFYMIAISFSAIGFIDFPVLTLYVGNLNIMPTTYLPLLYSLAMLVDALSALLFGFLFDKYGIKILAISSLLSASFSIFIFISGNLSLIIIGIILWGVGMGAQESILKSAVTVLVGKDKRAIGFGVFEFFFGFFWFLGSIAIGYLYEYSYLWLIVFSLTFEVLSIPFYIISNQSYKKNKMLDRE